MKRLFHFFVLLIFLMVSNGCKKSINDLYDNPNKPTSVPPSLLLKGILNQLYVAPYTDYEKWNQYYIINYDYYGNNRYDFGSGTNYYGTLKNVQAMEDQAKLSGGAAINPYEALGKFFRAYFYTSMSLQVGDIPMTEALKGLDNLTPVYNTQKEVFLQSFKWLEEANNDLGQLIDAPDKSNTTEGQLLKGDFYFGNNLLKWRKTVNTFRLRLLIELTKKSQDADLMVSQQFSSVVNNKIKYPLMENMSDNLQYVYLYPTNLYPNNPSNFGFDALRYNTSATYIGLLTQLSDPRVFVTAEPATALVQGGKSPTGFDSFVGASPGEDLGVMYVKTNNGQYSLLNRKHYYDTYTGEPSIQIGYPELLFNIAEAINRGWLTSGPSGTAEDYYKAGIKASMDYYNIPEAGSMQVYFLHPGSSLGNYDTYTVNVDFNTYYNSEGVKYTGNTTDGLKKILIQNYLALFRHSGLEAYYQFRRTGIPGFTTGPGTGNSSRIALRFKYSSAEKTANPANYENALKLQYNGNDDINGLMWILK